MVYRGKPSTACGECRKRRSRCDESLPACGQCIKAKRICPGYRNQADLMFFDESSKVVKKNRTRSTNTADQSLAVQDLSRMRNYIVAQQEPPIQLTGVVLYQPLHDVAVNFFMTNYVGSDPTTSQFDYLPNLYLKNGSPSPVLRRSIEAVGMAGFAKASRRSELVLRATKSYISAIREINNALSTDVSAAQDSTLISVMLLAMFEVMILPRASGLQNLTKHLNGAISIAALRLQQNIDTKVGRKLLGTLVQSVIMNCWMQNIPLPIEFVAFKKHLGGKANPSSIHANFLDIVMDLVNFRHALTDGKFDSETSIISDAVAIDGQFRTFEETMPTAGQFKSYRSSTESEELVYGGYYHVHSRFFTAHLWNNVRLCRIRLHRVILTQCGILRVARAKYSSLSNQVAKSEATIINLAQEICASVPQLSGYLEQLQSYSRKDYPDFPGIPSESAGKTSTSIPLSTHFLYDPSPFKHQKSNPASHPPEISVTDHDHDFPTPRPESLCHMLYQLHSLSTITFLPTNLHQWMQQRIRWMEASADPVDLPQIRAMLKNRTEDGFPIPVDYQYVLRDFQEEVRAPCPST